MTKIKLGDKVKDIITGFKGIAVGRTFWIAGCERITVQPVGVDKEGKPYESVTFDEPMLVIIGRKRKPVKKTDTGGPRPEPAAKFDPTKQRKI